MSHKLYILAICLWQVTVVHHREHHSDVADSYYTG